MRAKDIKVGGFYETKVGVGECLAIHTSRPPTVRMNIMLPFPRGIIYVPCKDVLREVPKKMS